MVEEHKNIWTALGKKVSYAIFFSVVTVCITAMGYMFTRQNTNFAEHNALATKTELQQVKFELKQEIRETEARIISAIYESKSNGRMK